MLRGKFDSYILLDPLNNTRIQHAQRESDGKQCLLFQVPGIYADTIEGAFQYAVGLISRAPRTLVPYIDYISDSERRGYLVSLSPDKPSLAEVINMKSIGNEPFTEAEIYDLYIQLRDAATFLSNAPGYNGLFSSHGAISAETIILTDTSRIALLGYGLDANANLITDIRSVARLLIKIVEINLPTQESKAYTKELDSLIQVLKTGDDFPPIINYAKRSVEPGAFGLEEHEATTRNQLLLSTLSQHHQVITSPASTNAPQVELSATKIASTTRTLDPRISMRDLSRTGLAFTMPSYDALIDAVRQKNLDRVTALLGRGLTPPPLCPKTALMEAASLGYYEIAQVLINTEAMRISSEGHTALHYALESGHLDVALALHDLERQDHSVAVLNHDLTNLLFAVEAEDIDSVWYWREKQSAIPDKDGFTALHKATQKNYLSAIRILVQHGHGIMDRDGKVALHYCAEQNYIDAARILAPYEQGSLTPDGLTTLRMAYTNGFLELARELVQYEGPSDTVPTAESDFNTDLMLAVVNKDPFYTFCYLRQARLRNVFGMTALMLAAKHGNQQAIEDLIEVEGGMQVDQQDWIVDEDSTSLAGKTALMFAAEAGSLSAVARLSSIEAGLVDKAGETALMKATIMNHTDIIDLLAPLESNIRSFTDATALTIAIRMGYQEACTILKDYEGPPATDVAFCEQGSEHVMTPLMKAADAGNFNYTWCLQSQKNLVDSKGWTALMYAAAKGHADCCELLLETKNIASADGETAWQIAQRNSHEHLLSMLEPDSIIDEQGSYDLHRMATATGPIITKKYSHQYKVYNGAGLTALMLRAGTRGCRSIDQSLLEAESGMRSKDGQTYALKCALLAGNKDMVDILLPLEHDFLAEDGYTDFMIDAFYGRIDQITSKTALYGVQANDGTTALMLACAAGQIDVARILLGSEVGLQTKQGIKASQLAIQSGNKDLCNLIVPLELGFIPTAPTYSNTSEHDSRVNTVEIVTDNLQTSSVSLAKGDIVTNMISSLHFDSEMLSRWEKQMRHNHLALQRIIGPPPSADSNGNTVLHRAALNGDLAGVHASIYLAKTTNNMRQTALMFAASQGHSAIVEALIHYEANMIDADGHFAAELAMISGDLTSIAILASVERDLLMNAGYTQLMFAVLADDIHIVKKCVKEGLLRQQTMTGQTALMIAVLLARLTLIPLLLEERDLCMTNGVTAYAIATSLARKNCFTDELINSLRVDILLDSDGNTQLMQKAISGEVGYVKAFLYMHGNYNKRGYNALHLSVVNRRHECVSVLKSVESGARLQGSFNTRGIFPVVEPTALMIATMVDDCNSIKELVPIEATLTDSKGRTALMLAAIYGHADACKVLAPYEAGSQDNFDLTALMFAATYGHVECVQVLAKLEANIVTPVGDTALSYAAEHGRVECVRALAPYEAKAHGARAVAIASEAAR
ncbi:Protein 21.1, partial [Giardia lamblia P15]